ncbi:MAG: helix-turn-helix transcriptional regulator [Oscillospiraceae bacterium]|nr:helix-turn-helix transcriptional regulator [Oscillospiraceae bacterium]
MEIEMRITYKNEKLQALRLAAGLSQSQLAAATGINVRMIQHYEQGAKDINGAKLHTLLKLCAALKCRLSDVVTDPELIKLLDMYEKKK